jgi:hypothetical protein
MHRHAPARATEWLGSAVVAVVGDFLAAAAAAEPGVNFRALVNHSCLLLVHSRLPAGGTFLSRQGIASRF